MKISQNAKHAIYIGTLCSCSYLAVYFVRNILSAVTPQMTESGAFHEEYIGRISSLYFIFYALGQLINGFIGDRVKARYMISVGLLCAGMCNLIFSQVAHIPGAAMVAYGASGFFLSMIYGPMTKVVAENTDPLYTPRCSLGYTFASFLGSPMAGVVAVFVSWQGVFSAGSIALTVMAILSFLWFLYFEKKGLVKYHQYQRTEETHRQGWFRELLRHQIIQFSVIAVLTGIVRTAVVFWLPTYIAQYLGYGSKRAAAIFTAVTFALSFVTFIAVFVYERLGRSMERTVLVMFISSAMFFLLVFLVRQPVLNLIFLVLAVMASNGAATMLWSRYCPGLRDTGMVSAVTGFLDCLSYVAAGISTSLFANAVGAIGWSNLILVWLGLALLGVVTAFPYGAVFRQKKAKKTTP